ncbi:MAG: DNA primase large subunit PriL [Candidatus Thermoplasmatota archaeon]|nr:DNA primase large subunit PriL [Candidatus Thermoplasmatota archaeon]
MADITPLSRFPFLKRAREFVREGKLTMADMLGEGHETVQKRSLERIEEAIEGKELGLPSNHVISDEDELLSYPVARFMVTAVGDTNLIKWFSHHEGERGRFYLEKEPTDSVLSIGKELGFEAVERAPGQEPRRPEMEKVIKGVRPAGDRMLGERRSYWVRFTNYLPPKRNISGPEWDLINQRMVGGFIELNRHSYVRLLQELIKNRVEEGLHREVEVPRNRALKDMIKGLKVKVETRRKKYAPTELGKMTVTRLPPCIKQILGMSQAGENLPHHARFALVTFLHAIGQSSEEIFKVFATAPDFKEDMVRYQVEHITGSSSAINYYVPNCDTMRSGGICYDPDTLCGKEWLTNPVTYYRIKGKPRRPKREVSSS